MFHIVSICEADHYLTEFIDIIIRQTTRLDTEAVDVTFLYKGVRVCFHQKPLSL